MQFIKATKAECEAYNLEVTDGEKYSNKTKRWANVIEREGNFYIALHPNYPTNLNTVNSFTTLNNITL